jgi:hypothetical protein
MIGQLADLLSFRANRSYGVQESWTATRMISDAGKATL